MGDYDPPSMFNETFPRARKDHKCCECGATISAGEVYQRVVGVWYNDFSWFKICSSCQDIRLWLHNQDVLACFGDLHETLFYSDLELPPLLQLALEAK